MAGRLIAGVFGAVWAVFAVLSLAAFSSRIVATLLLALTGVFLCMRGLRRQSSSNAMFRSPAYVAAVVLECAAIFAAMQLCPRFGMQPQFLSILGVIVGLHFLGLWKATGQARFVVVSVAMVAVSLISMALPHSTAGVNPSQAFLGVGNALVLWISASR